MINVLAAIIANCVPDQGMGCFPCCGVTSNTSTLAQSGDMGLGVAVVLIGVLIWLARKG